MSGSLNRVVGLGKPRGFAEQVADAVVAKLGLDDSGLLKLAEKMAEGGYSLQDFIWRARGESL